MYLTTSVKNTSFQNKSLERFANSKDNGDMKAGDYIYEITLGDQKHNGKFSVKPGEELNIKVVI